MSTWSWTSLQQLWATAGGAGSRAQVMAAIALAESSGESGVVSPAGAIGLWQIMPFWAPHFGQSVGELYLPLVNAADAKAISGDGYHLGAWDTCYNPPSSAAHRLDLTWPQAGSPAWNELRSHGGSGGGGQVVTTAFGGPSAEEQALIRQFNEANFIQTHQIPANIAWIAFNASLHYTPPRPVIV